MWYHVRIDNADEFDRLRACYADTIIVFDSREYCYPTHIYIIGDKISGFGGRANSELKTLDELLNTTKIVIGGE